MATLPTNAELTGASVTKSQLQTRLGTLRDFIATLLGTDDSTPSASRVLLGVPAVNWLLNPDGEVAQGLPASSSDGDYDFDQWYTVTQTGSVAATQLSNPENGYRHGMRLTQSQASAQRMGFCQIIEGKDAIKLRGKTVTFGGRYRISASTNIRLAVLEWTGTEDAPVKDQVNNWTSTTYTAGNFFKSTTLTVAGVSSAVAMTANTAANASVSATISASANNIIVMAWTESTQAQNVTFDRWGQRAIEASSLIDYIRRSYAEELGLCRRWCISLGGEALFERFADGYWSSTTVARVDVVAQMARPSGVALSYSNLTHLTVIGNAGTGIAVTALSVDSVGVGRTSLSVTVSSGGTTGYAANLFANNTLSARLQLSCRLGT